MLGFVGAVLSTLKLTGVMYVDPPLDTVDVTL